MIEGKTRQGGSQDNLVRRGLALVASLLVVLLVLSLAIAAPAAGAGASVDIQQGEPTTSTTTTTTTTTQPSTTPTTRPTTTQPPQTTASTAPPATDPPSTEAPDPDEDDDDEPVVTETTRGRDEGGVGPLDTTENLLVKGNGIPGLETAQAPEEDETTETGGSSDEDRVIWMIIAGLGAVALLVALLTWRYWLLTRPGIDLSDDDPDGGGFDGGGGYYGGDPPAGPADPFGAPAPRVADVNPMTTGMPPAPAATGWQDPAGPPRQGPQRPPQRRGADRGTAPEPTRRGRPPRRPDGDPFAAPGPPPSGAPPQRGRSGRGRRGGGDPFWDDVGDQPPRRQPPDQGRRRPDPGDRGPW